MQFTTKVFFRQIPKDLLRAYFDRRGLLADFKWDAMADGDADALYEAWSGLPDDQRLAAEGDFRAVAEIGSHDCVPLFIEEGRFHKIDLVAELDARDGLWHKAFWVFLEQPRVFEVARYLDHADHLNRRYWQKRTDLPKKAPDASAAAGAALGLALSAYFRDTQGRGGKQAKVDRYLRGEEHYFFAYPADYADTSLEYDSRGEFDRRPRKPAFEVIFIYHPKDGTLDVHAQGGREVVRELQELFARVILGVELGLESRVNTPYELSCLKSRAFAFKTEPADGITEVRVKALRLGVLGTRRTILFSTDPRKIGENIYDHIEESLHETRRPLSNLNVTLATIQMLFTRGNGRPKSVSFNVTPDSCNLGDSPEHIKAKACLKNSGIARV